MSGERRNTFLTMDESEHELRTHIDRKGTINNDHPVCPQPAGFNNIFLKRHQLQTIHAMMELEEKKQTVDSGEYLVSEIGVLGNKVGSGKSFCILGLILQKRRLIKQAFLKQIHGTFAFVMNDRSFMNIQGGNLIVVPTHIVKPVWVHYIHKYTTLSFEIVTTSNINEWDMLCKPDIVICSARFYNILMKTCPWTWSRVIFDEADSIKLPACFRPKTRFVWFVTSSIQNLIFASGGYWKYDKHNKIVHKMITRGIVNNGYIKSTFKTLESSSANSILKLIIIKLNDLYVNKYLDLPPIVYHDIMCKNPRYMSILDGTIPSNVTSFLNGYDNESALDALGCPVDSKENLISFVCRSLSIQRQNCIHKLIYLDKLENENNEMVNNVIAKKRTIVSNISEVDTKMSKIRERILSIDAIDAPDCYCPICLDTTPGQMCMLACCLNTFCIQCVKTLLQRMHHECPLCRCVITIDAILKPVTESSSDRNHHRTKDEKLTDILRDISKRSESVVIFTLYENTLSAVNSLLNSLHFKYKTLNGNSATISKAITLFNEGMVKILTTNGSTYGCGLNLTNADNILLYQNMDSCLKSQIIGRAYRMGRKQTLNVFYLLHENEN